ncbi:MAG: hypothetical protein GXX99_00100, partial [Clostridiales bacterium]|nr:hypothetical protein [Clostridiales bacterium]
MKMYFAGKRIAAFLLAIFMLLSMLPVAAWAAGPAVGLAQGITGSKTILVTLSSGSFAAAVSHTHFTLSGTGAPEIQGIYRDGNTAIRLSLAANIEAAHTLSITAEQAAFEAGTTPFEALSVYAATRAAGTAKATAGTGDITVKLTSGSFNDNQYTTSWLLGGSASEGNSIAAVERIGQQEVKLTLGKSLGASDVLTVNATQSAFSNVATAPFAPALTVAIAPSADPVCEIGGTGYATLGLALAAVQNGQSATVKLLKDIQHNGQIFIDHDQDKRITFDLNGCTLTVVHAGGPGLLLYSGGVDYVDTTASPGQFNVTGTTCGVQAWWNGTVVKVTNATATAPSLNLDAQSYGVYARYGAQVTVAQNAQGNKYGAYASDAYGGVKSKVIVGGNAIAETVYASSNPRIGAIATSYAELEVAGNASGGWVGVYASGSSTAKVDGKATGGLYGVYAELNSTAEVGEAEATAEYGAAAYNGNQDSSVAVRGNAKAHSVNGIGAIANSGTITIDGVITAPVYVRTGSTDKTSGDYTTDALHPGYRKYTDGTGTVWVKESAAATQLATPTGLVWDIATAGTIKAKWNAVDGAQNYAVRLYKAGVYQGLLETNATSLHLTTYLQGFGTGTYTFTVKALAPSGSADYTDSAAATSGEYAYTALVCQIGATGYTTLGAAITAALNAGGATTITLLQSIDEAAPIAVAEANITFELGSFDLTIDTSATPGSTALTVQNGGKVSCSGSGKLHVEGAERGLSAAGGSEIHVSGSVVAGKYGVYTSGGTG